MGTTTYELVSVKLGDEILTADTNDVYSVKVGTKDLTIDVTTKAQVVGKGDVSMDRRQHHRDLEEWRYQQARSRRGR